MMRHYVAVMLVLGVLIAMSGAFAQEPTDNLFVNPSFEDGFTTEGAFSVPDGWELYAGNGEGMAMEPTDDAEDGESALIIRDGDVATEIGISQAIKAEGGIAYEASAMVKALKPSGAAGAKIQLRFLPSNRIEQVDLGAAPVGAFLRISVLGVAPEDTTSIRVYYYTHKGPTPEFVIDNVSLIGGVEPPPPPPPPPPPLDPPVYDTLKDLHLQTHLVRDGEALVPIVTSARYAAQAEAIAASIERTTGARPAIIADDDEATAIPADGGQLTSSFIVLGNRSTNAMIEELYNRFYTLLDLRYPGRGGHEVRTCHSPFGGGHNIVFIGGSDDAGVAAAAETFIARLADAGGERGSLNIGWLREITPGEGIEFSHNPEEILIWDASAGYNSTGYFGWNSISKHMAAYYMTGDEHHAREFLRLAFPDAEAKRQITRIDGERIENKDDPLAGPYHYNAHMMILFWDLIEEDPFFSDEDRLRITNAFSRHLLHEWRQDRAPYSLQSPASAVGSRHGQWSAIALYCLSRYFARDYDDPVWKQGLLGAHMSFAGLEEHAWVHGEADNLFWYNTGHAPILRYMLKKGWRGPVQSGVLDTLLRGQEILATGKHGDTDFRSASITFLHRSAYLTGDGRWLEYLRRTDNDLSVARVGQSFWPEESLQPVLPMDMVGHWSIHEMPRPMWLARGTGFPLEQAFQFGSFRSAPDDTGDYILIDGYNGASRNPYHTFAILEQRLNGATLLKGYGNQVVTRVDGMVEPQVAMNGALLARDVVGEVAACVGEVPNAAYSSWRRTLAQRIGRYALVVDRLTMREGSDNTQVQTSWEVTGGGWDSARNAISLSATGGAFTPVGWHSIRALDSPCTSEPAGEEFLANLGSLSIMLLRATEPGQWMEMAFTLDRPLTGEVYADFLRYVDRGVVRILIDGEVVAERVDLWGETADQMRAPLGRHELAAGEHRLRVEVVDRGRAGEQAFIGLIGVSIKPDEAPEEPLRELRHEIVPADPLQVRQEGRIFTLEWTGPTEISEELHFFTLIGSSMVGDEAQLSCLRLSDNAAALGLPQPAVAIAGGYEGTEAELAIIASDHLYARNATAIAAGEALLTASAPVALDWDFEAGTLHALAESDLKLSLSLASAEGITVNGAAATATAARGMVAIELPAGESSLTGVRPAASTGAWIAQRQTEAAGIRQAAARVDPPGALPEVPALRTLMAAQVEGVVEHVLTIPDGAGGQMICAAGGQQITFLRPDGTQAAVAQTDGPIRVIHWWPEHELLLAGCADEQVIAFNRAGERRWVFVSEMDPAVFRAAKDYWFKSAPAHAGIWGVSSGVFLNGESQAFVGSACTLEFIDGNGKLVHRMPQFWGDPHVFQIVNGPDGSMNLLAARRINGSDTLGIINNETLRPDVRGFHTVPSGHSYIGGWSSMNRYHVLYEDLDGDGTREIISEKNGSWNRVTAWDESGSALYDASFGPGRKSPYRNMRGLVVADLDADGKMEVVTATASGLIVCLDHTLQKKWARAMPSAPNVMTAIPDGDGHALIVACDDGTVAAINAAGEVTRASKLRGRPGDGAIAVLDTPEGPAAVIGTGRGEIVTLSLQ